MKILSIHPALPGGEALARFDVELPGRLRLFGLTLKRTRTGELRVWPPNCGGRHAASLHPELALEIAQAAIAALGSRAPHDHR